MKFRTKILTSGKTATGIEVPEKIVAGLGSGRKPAVKVTINGYTYRSTVATMGGRFMVGVSADVREKAKVAGGDMVDVGMELDTAPREVEVPEDLRKALGRDGAAKKAFEALSYSNRRKIVMGIEGAKAAETRERRIAKAVVDLRNG